MSELVAIQKKSVTDKFSRNLALLICDFVRSGAFKTSLSAIDRLSRPEFVRGDEDDDDIDQPHPDIYIDPTGTNLSYWCEVDYQTERRVSITYVAPGNNCVTPAHSVPGSVYIACQEGARPCDILVPAQLALQARTLDRDGTYQAIFDVTTRSLFLSWPAPNVRENCVAMFHIPEEVMRSLS